MIQILKQVVFSLQCFNITLRVYGVPSTRVLLTLKKSLFIWFGYATLMILLVAIKKNESFLDFFYNFYIVFHYFYERLYTFYKVFLG